MARILKCMLFALCIFAYQERAYGGESEGLLSSATTYFGYAGKAISIGQSMYEGADKLYRMLQPKTTKDSESDQKIEPGMEQRITDQIKHVSKKLDSLKVNIQNMKEEIIDKIVNEIPEQIGLKSNLQEIYLRINQIENLYENFITYVTGPQEYSHETLEDFAEHATSHDLNELPNVLKTMHWLLTQTDVNAGESVLTILSRNSQASAQMCKRRQSLQQLLYGLYNTIVLADIKGFTMIQTSNTIRELLTQTNHAGEKVLAEKQYISRITNTAAAVKGAMASASRAVWACDSYNHEEDVTYTQLKNLFQKYVVNEVDISSVETCTDVCSDFKQATVHTCFDGKICAKQRTCNGQLWDCEHKVGSNMYICPSDPSSNRRYEYIEYGNSQRYGPPGTCSQSSVKVSSWTRFFVSCSYCMCTCDDNNVKDSDRYVNLRKVLADASKNYVVTGVRFRKDNHIIHIQIQQGKVLPGGVIDVSSVHWKPIESYKVGEPLPSTVGTNYEYVPRENYDYYKFEYKVKRQLHRDDNYVYQKAAVNLNDLDLGKYQLGKDYVVTGVYFEYGVTRTKGYSLYLNMLVSPFDFETGKVDANSEIYSSLIRKFETEQKVKVSESKRTEIILDKLDIPTRSGTRAVPTSQPNQVLYFTTSAWETDAGQSTIPFIDLQSVETNPPTPLSGIGVIHKSSPGSGGFLSLKTFTYNYEPHLKE